MTPQGRTLIAMVLVIGGFVLIVVGVLKGGTDGTTAIASGTGFITLVGGYAFGDRNGEKRLAAALTVLDAQQRQNEAGVVVPPVVVGTPPPAPIS